MICQKLVQLCEATVRYKPAISRSELIRIACQACQRLDVCPALSTEEFEARGLHKIQPGQEPQQA